MVETRPKTYARDALSPIAVFDESLVIFWFDNEVARCLSFVHNKKAWPTVKLIIHGYSAEHCDDPFTKIEWVMLDTQSLYSQVLDSVPCGKSNKWRYRPQIKVVNKAPIYDAKVGDWGLI